MPLSNKNLGSNLNTTSNMDYCKFCFYNGKFTNPELTIEEQINRLAVMAVTKFSIPKSEAFEIARTTLPKLKRWI